MVERSGDEQSWVDLIKNAKTTDEFLQILHDAGLAPESKRGVHPLTEEERQRWADIRWAENAPEVRAKHLGEFIVPYQRQIVAHGHDPVAVLQEAARVTGRKPDGLTLWSLYDPLDDPSR